MTPEQLVAICHPCRLACETAHPRFLHRKLGYSLSITVNSGYE